MTEHELGRLDWAMDETLRCFRGHAVPNDLRAHVLARLVQARPGRHPVMERSLAWRVAMTALAIGVVAAGMWWLTPQPAIPEGDALSTTAGARQPGADTRVGKSDRSGIVTSRSSPVPTGPLSTMRPGVITQGPPGSAQSAGPPGITAGATIMNWDGTLVSQGENEWTCLPDHPETEVVDPWCVTDRALIDLLPQAVRVGANIPPPRKAQNVAPVYPPDAEEARAEGIVVLEVVVGLAGQVGALRTLRSSGHDSLDQAAFEAVQGWRYESTRLNGRPVPLLMTVTANFTLR